MNKKTARSIVGWTLGLALAIGVGTAVGASSKKAVQVDAVDGTTQYSLITSTGDLQPNKSYIITNGTSGTVKAIGIATNTNNRKTASVTVADGKITRGDEVMSFTLGGSSGAWTFQCENYATSGTLYLASADSGSNNYLRCIATAGTATIAFSGDEAVINIGPHSTRTQIRYNTSSNLFACYSSGQQPVYLWKEVSTATEPVVTLDPASVTLNTGNSIGTTVLATTELISNPAFTWTTEDTNISLENTSSSEVKIIPNSSVAGSATVSLNVTGKNSSTSADVSINKSVTVTLETPLSVAGALALIGDDDGSTTFSGKYVKGIVSALSENHASDISSYGNTSYYISDDGTTTNQFYIYRGKYLGGEAFTSPSQLQLGDTVVVYGNLKNYNGSTPEALAGNYLVSLKSEARLSLSPASIEVTVETDQPISASPSNFDTGTIVYEFDEDDCASLSYAGNTITVHGDAVGTHTFTVTGKVNGVAQASATLQVNVVAPYPTQISKSGYTSFTDTQTFAEGTGSVTITYSDGSKATKHLGDAGVKLLISDVEVSADTSTANYVGANSAKITYTEGGHTVETDKFTLNVNAELAVTSFEGVPEYLIIDSEDPAHSATVTVNYKSLNGAPELSVVSSNPTKLPVSFDESDNVYDEGSKTGVATFGITAGTTAGQYSVTVSATYGNRTESKSFSINVRGEAPAASEGSYQKALELSDLENGNYVIAANTGSVFGMTRSLSGGKYAFSSALTVTDNKISGATGDEINYYLTVAGTDNSRTATIKNLSNNKYVTYNGSTNLGEADSAYDWTITKQSSGVFRITSVATPARGLVARGGSTKAFGGYAVSNVTSTPSEYFDLTLFKYVEPVASSFDLVNGFVTNYMHMNDVSIGNGSDTGACKGDSGYYLTAKRAWNTMVEGYEGDDLQTVFSTSFEDAYARYNAWAVAMNDAEPFDGKDEVVSFIRNALVNRALDASTSLPLVVTVAALGTAAAAGFFLFQRKRKEF